MADRDPVQASRVSLGPALVVEDNAVLALEIEQALREAGAGETASCASIARAMQELDRLRPGVLVIDVRLADRDDGWKLAELAVELGPESPLIVFSTAAPERIPAHIRALGHVLVKPFPMEDLVALVRRHARRRGWLTRLRGAVARG